MGLVQQHRISESCKYKAVCTHSQALCEDLYWVLTRKTAGRVGDQKEHPSVVQMWRRSVGAGGKP